jgi:hypothetical protein
VAAGKAGLLELRSSHPRASTWGISREGSALLRDFKITRKYLRSKDEESEDGLPDNRDDEEAAAQLHDLPPEDERQAVVRLT